MTRRQAPRRVLFLLLLTALACNLPSLSQPTPAPGSPAQPTAPGGLPSPASLSPTPPPLAYPPPFAKYSLPKAALPVAFHGYDLPLDLATVQGVAEFELSDAQKALLQTHGFAVVPPESGGYWEFYQIYEDVRYEEQPVFITTDSVLHVYHLLFDKTLRDLETRFFVPTLEALTLAMIEACEDQLSELTGTPLEEPARRNLAFFVVAARLLQIDVTIPASVTGLVQAELANIEAHSSPALSPIWDRDDLPSDKKLIEDYTQYIPRGHYTRSDTLKRYFLTMMWYGRLTFRLRDGFETQRALLMTRALETARAGDGTPAHDLWQSIFEPTVFLVGKADDLSYFEYAALSDSVFGADAPLTAFADAAGLGAFQEAAKTLPPPRVNSMWVWISEDTQEATQGFRFMGQRFTIDAYVYGQLIWRKVGTSDNQRGLPKALDFFAALGSEEALSILVTLGETAYANYGAQMDKTRAELAALELDTWTENVYWAWLYALQPIIEEKDTRYPEFMRTRAWTRKDLNAALGSYTELKHDTILYAKQVMAEMGGGAPKAPKGYVEPNPEAFARLLALAEMTSTGLAERGLLDETMQGNLANLIDLLAFLQSAAERELASLPLNTEDYDRIHFIGGELEALTIAASDCEEEGPGCSDLQDQKAALVADIATGTHPTISGLAVLEEAIGRPTRIYVVLPDIPRRLAVGAVFTYYEFELPAAERMTDEAWQALVAAGDTPLLPFWTDDFLAP